MASNRGISLLELLIGVAFIATGFTLMAMLIPRASTLTLDNKMRWQGTELARTQIEQYKTTTYGLIQPTESALLTSVTTCDCSQLADDKFQQLDATTTVISGHTFTIHTCINYVDFTNGRKSVCPGPTVDTNTKYIRTQVEWIAHGTRRYDTNAEILINR